MFVMASTSACTALGPLLEHAMASADTRTERCSLVDGSSARSISPLHPHRGQLGRRELAYEEGAVIGARPADGMDLPLAGGVET
jgi:hypothetical protein